jgi:RecB family endonuclease NucS
MVSSGGEEIIVLDSQSVDINRISDLFHRNSKIYTAVIIGECEIHYQGRASSIAPLGTRIVIYKPDGSLLVHEGKDRDPLNWQPPGSLCISDVKNNSLEIRCRSTRYGYEIVTIRFRKILSAIWCKLSTKGLEIRGTERDIVEVISSNPEIIASGAKIIGREVETPNGKIDLILRDDAGNIYVVEVKNEKAGIGAINQLDRYVKHIESIYRKAKQASGEKIVGVLVSNGISKRARELIIDKGYLHIDAGSFKSSKYPTLTKYIK